MKHQEIPEHERDLCGSKQLPRFTLASNALAITTTSYVAYPRKYKKRVVRFFYKWFIVDFKRFSHRSMGKIAPEPRTKPRLYIMQVTFTSLSQLVDICMKRKATVAWKDKATCIYKENSCTYLHFLFFCFVFLKFKPFLQNVQVFNTENRDRTATEMKSSLGFERWAELQKSWNGS